MDEEGDLNRSELYDVQKNIVSKNEPKSNETKNEKKKNTPKMQEVKSSSCSPNNNQIIFFDTRMFF